MKITNVEYNDYVVGYVLTMNDGRNINVQFDKCFLNYFELAFEARIGCEGDETHDAFNYDELAEIREFIANNEAIKKFGEMLTVAYYANPEILVCPLLYSDVEDAFKNWRLK